MAAQGDEKEPEYRQASGLFLGELLEGIVKERKKNDERQKASVNIHARAAHAFGVQGTQDLTPMQRSFVQNLETRFDKGLYKGRLVAPNNRFPQVRHGRFSLPDYGRGGR